MSQWDFIMGKRLRLCHYHAVTQIQSTGKHQGLEQPVIMSFSKEIMKCISPLRKGLSTHANIVTHMRAYVRYCTYNICHNNGMHIQTRTHTHIYPL